MKFILELCKFNYIVDQIILSIYLTIKYLFSKNRIILSIYLKNTKEKYVRIDFFFRRRVWISIGSSHIFLKVLKLPPTRLDNILSVQKNKEKYGKIENNFFVSGFGYQSEVVTFS